jgi:hypothetical protein
VDLSIELLRAECFKTSEGSSIYFEGSGPPKLFLLKLKEYLSSPKYLEVKLGEVEDSSL